MSYRRLLVGLRRRWHAQWTSRLQHVNAECGRCPRAPRARQRRGQGPLLPAAAPPARRACPCGVQGVCRALRRRGYDACDEFFRSKFPATADTRARRAVRLVYICVGAHLVPAQRRVLSALTRVKFSAATNGTFGALVKCVAEATRACTWGWGLGVVCTVVAARALGASAASVRVPGAARIVAGKCPEELRELDNAAVAVMRALR